MTAKQRGQRSAQFFNDIHGGLEIVASPDGPQPDFRGASPYSGALYEWRVIRPERAVAKVAENRAYSVPRHFEARDFDISVMREAQAIRAVGGLKLPNRYQSLLLIAGDDRSIDLA